MLIKCLGALQSCVNYDKEARETAAAALGQNFGVSEATALHTRWRLKYQLVQPAFVPGLTAAMRDTRLAFALAHEYLALQD
jgi:hypothetical protein